MAAVAAVVCVIVTVAGCSRSEPEARVLLVGDSVMKETGEHVEEALESLPDIGSVEVENAGVNGSGMLTPSVYDWQTRARELVEEFDPDVVVVLFVGNYADDNLWAAADGSPIEGYTDEFFAAWGEQTNLMMETLTSQGAEVYLVHPPPLPIPEGERRVTALRDVNIQVATNFPGTALIDGTAALSDEEGRFADELPVPPNGEVETVRQPDGVHLTPAGGRLLAQAVAEVIAPSVVHAQEQQE
jgi:hypothetical protein